MMTRLFASALLVAGLSQAALAQSTSQPSELSGAATNAQGAEALPQAIQQQLTSSGFSDVRVVPRSFVVFAKDRNGRPVMMHLTPNSMMIMTEVPVSGSTTGAGGGNSTDSGQSGTK
jgi:hypothetical protein